MLDKWCPYICQHARADPRWPCHTRMTASFKKLRLLDYLILKHAKVFWRNIIQFNHFSKRPKVPKVIPPLQPSPCSGGAQTKGRKISADQSALASIADVET